MFSTAMILKETVELKGLLSFYPLVDFKTSREAKEACCPSAVQNSRTPKMFKQISEMYGAAAGKEREGWAMSPGLAGNEPLEALPGKVVIYTCEWDILAHEGEELRERLRGSGKSVGMRLRVLCMLGINF